MIKPVKFPQATNFLPAHLMDSETKQLIAAPFHYYNDPGGRYTVSCFELSDSDIEKIIKERRVWITAPFKSFPPLSLQIENPFTPNLTINENENSKSSGNNEQHNGGDYKLTVE